MSRSGYIDGYGDSDGEQWHLIMYRGAVTSAIRGKRGQAFLKEMLSALDAMPEKKLIREQLVDEYDSKLVCSFGAVGLCRGVDMSKIDPEDSSSVAGAFGVAEAMAREIVYVNDDWYRKQTPEERFTRMRAWVVGEIRKTKGVEHGGATGNEVA